MLCGTASGYLSKFPSSLGIPMPPLEGTERIRGHAQGGPPVRGASKMEARVHGQRPFETAAAFALSRDQGAFRAHAEEGKSTTLGTVAPVAFLLSKHESCLLLCGKGDSSVERHAHSTNQALQERLTCLGLWKAQCPSNRSGRQMSVWGKLRQKAAIRLFSN
jgi:hypothetical protein